MNLPTDVAWTKNSGCNTPRMVSPAESWVEISDLGCRRPSNIVSAQFRQTLQQTSQSYGAESIIKAEPAIRQLLKLDFEPKIAATIRSHFRQGMNQTLKTQVLPLAEQYKLDILQKYDQARAYLEKSLEKELSARSRASLAKSTEPKRMRLLVKKPKFLWSNIWLPRCLIANS